MSDKQDRPAWARGVRTVVRGVALVMVVGYTLLDELLFPLFRPFIAWLTGFRLFQRIGAALGRLPPYLALVALGVPFVVIEPAKLVAVWWAATGHVFLGTVTLILAQVLSLLVCERIFHAAYAPLMRIGWLKAVLGWLFGLRDRALAWVRATTIWRAAVRTGRAARVWWRRAIGSLR